MNDNVYSVLVIGTVFSVSGAMWFGIIRLVTAIF